MCTDSSLARASLVIAAISSTRINRSELCRLCDTDHARLVRVELVLTHKQRFRLSNIDLAVSAPDQEQFRSAGEKFRPAAFVGLNVGVLMAIISRND